LQFWAENIFSWENYFGFGENCFSFRKTFKNLARIETVLVETVSVFGKLLKTWPELKRFWWKLFYFPENY
jgi:hypothetical protein